MLPDFNIGFSFNSTQYILLRALNVPNTAQEANDDDSVTV